MALTAGAVAWLQSAEGEAAFLAAQAALVSGASTLRVIDQLRKAHSPEQARAVLALVEGRASAAGKFRDANRLFFDRESAEQATSEAVAQHTAGRFAGAQRIIDLGCGAGGDALALAVHAPVTAVDRAEDRLAMVRANASVRGLADHIATLAGDVQEVRLPVDADAVWLDPARRDDSGRTHDPARWSPPLSIAIAIASNYRLAGIKVAPGIDYRHVPEGAEVEFISLAGHLVEAVIWLGDTVRAPRSATILPAGVSVSGSPDVGTTPIGPPEGYLYDLDPSVGRAGLVDMLAPTLEAHLIEREVAYLTGREAHDSPFARRFRILEWGPFSERWILKTLRPHGANRVEVMRRASPVETNALELRLNKALATNSGGYRVLTVALTRHLGEHIAIVCERERPNVAGEPADSQTAGSE